MVFNKNWINFFLKLKPKLSSNLVFFYFFPALATVLILNYFLLNKPKNETPLDIEYLKIQLPIISPHPLTTDEQVFIYQYALHLGKNIYQRKSYLDAKIFSIISEQEVEVQQQTIYSYEVILIAQAQQVRQLSNLISKKVLFWTKTPQVVISQQFTDKLKFYYDKKFPNLRLSRHHLNVEIHY